MAEPSHYGTLEAMLGYAFRDRGLLEQALRHASWCNEHTSAPLEDNERLEAEGNRDQSKANLKQAGEKVKDAFKS